MKRSVILFAACGLAALLMAGSPARADSIWFFQSVATDSSGNSTFLRPTQPSPGMVAGGIEMIAPAYGWHQGSQEVVVSNLRAFGSAPLATPDVFTNTGYKIGLVILDLASMTFGELSLSGMLTGTITHATVDLLNSFTGETVKSLRLGDNVYTVSLSDFIPPGPQDSGILGSISARVSVEPAHAPEPSTLLLAGLGGAFVGLATWRKRRAGALS